MAMGTRAFEPIDVPRIQKKTPGRILVFLANNYILNPILIDRIGLAWNDMI